MCQNVYSVVSIRVRYLNQLPYYNIHLPQGHGMYIVVIELLQLPAGNQGSRYLLVCVDHFSRFVIWIPLPNKTAEAVAHALISNLFCPYFTPRVLLSDNGAEFRNALLEEISKQFNIKQTFTVTYHPSSNGLVERANRKILDVLRPL